MTDLVLGVVEVPYENEGARPAPRITKKGKMYRATAKRLEREEAKRKAGEEVYDGPATTVTVAKALEERYGVMQHFYDMHTDDIAGAVINSMNGALENLFAGGPVPDDPLAEAGQEIASAFRVFLMTGEIESLGISGIPTQAALERRSSRFKSGKGPSERPSFIDTGAYELAFRSWIEQ